MPAAVAPPAVSVVIPNWNGRRWLPGCLRSLSAQTLAPDEVIVVDNGSSDGSVAYLRAEHPQVTVLELGHNTGFAHAANRGLAAAGAELVALINTDVVLHPEWLQRMSAALHGDPGAASVACKMLQLDAPGLIYDAGDVLRRDGACEQRGRFGPDDGRWDLPEEVFGACAGAALYRREAVTAIGGFDERYFAYLEDVDLALRLRLAGWRCRYEPVVAGHAGAGSSSQLTGGSERLVVRNTLLLVAKTFPMRWLPFVAYRQAGWAWHARRERRLGAHLRALTSALPLLTAALHARGPLRAASRVSIEHVVPPRPFRGRAAGGHPSQHEHRRPSGGAPPAAASDKVLTVSMDASPIPRWGLPLTPPRPRVLVEWLSTSDSVQWPPAPAGDGRPVMLIPGFMAGDQSLTRMALWLRTGGFVLARSGIRWNSGCMEPTVQSVEQRLERAVERTGRRALIVGQSRGGCIGRALAVLRPDLVDTLVTLGSPLRDQLAVRPRVWPSILTVGVLGTLGVPGMFSLSCLNGDCCARTRVAADGPFPTDVKFLSLYSRSDEVVRWEACLDPAAIQVEVHASHVGMAMAREVWLAVAEELGRTVTATV